MEARIRGELPSRHRVTGRKFQGIYREAKVMSGVLVLE